MLGKSNHHLQKYIWDGDMLVPRRVGPLIQSRDIFSTAYQMSVFLKELDDESHQASGPQVLWPGPMFIQFSPRKASQVHKSPPTYRFFFHPPQSEWQQIQPLYTKRWTPARCVFFWPLDVSFFASDAFYHITCPTSQSSSSPKKSPFLLSVVWGMASGNPLTSFQGNIISAGESSVAGVKTPKLTIKIRSSTNPEIQQSDSEKWQGKLEMNRPW